MTSYRTTTFYLRDWTNVSTPPCHLPTYHWLLIHGAAKINSGMALGVVGNHITNAHCHPCQGELNPISLTTPFFNNPFALIDHVVNKNNKLFCPCVNHYITLFMHFLLVNPDRCINGMPISCPQIWWVHSPVPKSLSMKQSHGQRVLNCQLSRKMEKVKIMY